MPQRGIGHANPDRSMRRVSVAFFLGDTAFVADGKFRRLARRLPDSDDFNSAVGAYFVGLAAARRNGSPDIDMAVETSSRFIDDLVAVGLLEEGGFPLKAWQAWSPRNPVAEAGGRARAAGAERTVGGTFLPVQPHQLAGPAGTAGPAFYSPPITSMDHPGEDHPNEDLGVRGGVGGALEDPVDVYFEITTRVPRGGTLEYLNRMASDYGDPLLIKALRATDNSPMQGYLSRVEMALTKTTEKAKNARKPRPKPEPTPEEVAAREHARAVMVAEMDGYTPEKHAEAVRLLRTLPRAGRGGPMTRIGGES